MYTVLVVDDSSDSLSLINDILESQGISTLVALEGIQAIAIANKIQPDIILLDAIMPKLDGFETCKQLKSDANLKHIPIIFMTGLKDSESILKGLNAGGVDYITKPVNPDELIARIKVHANNAQITTSARQALDSIGQNLFAINEDGDLLWSTSHTDALLKGECSDSDSNYRIVIETAKGIMSTPSEESTRTVNTPEGNFELTLISKRTNGESTFRLVFQEPRISGEKKLRDALDLTNRESEVLYWLSMGKTNKEIAQILDIGVRTVNKHLEQVFFKLEVDNRTLAASIAFRIL